MPENKKSPKVIVFRVILMAAFVIGLIYVIQFISLGVKSEDIDQDEFLKLCGRWANTYYLYLIVTVISLIMSIVCFQSTGKVVSVIRTFFIAVSTALLLWPIKAMNVFKKAAGIDFDDWDEVSDMYREVNRLNDEEAVTSMAVSLCVVVIFFILFITSVVALVKKPKNN